jgi:signal transduction histidine kinase
MLSFLGAMLRVLIGFIIACLAAGAVQVLFAVTPAELMVAGDERLGEAFNWGLLTATQIAVFAAPFAFIAIIISEWQGLRSFAFHSIVAMAISVAGFGLIHATESPTEASIVNSYAMAAYLTSGFVGGFLYWLSAGRWARQTATSPIRMESNRKSSSSDAPPPREKAVGGNEMPKVLRDQPGSSVPTTARGRSDGGESAR